MNGYKKTAVGMSVSHCVLAYLATHHMSPRVTRSILPEILCDSAKLTQPVKSSLPIECPVAVKKLVLPS
jgi:hypothetical protein